MKAFKHKYTFFEWLVYIKSIHYAKAEHADNILFKPKDGGTSYADLWT